MKCPYCGAEMERGFLQGSAIWTREKKGYYYVASYEDVDLMLKDYVRENAYLCWECHKIIVDVEETLWAVRPHPHLHRGVNGPVRYAA